MTPRLEVADATVRFGSASVLTDVHLDVAQGEVLAILGPSGAGKSTVLRAIAGLQALAAGRILIDGVDCTDTPPHRRGVGLMFQDHVLFPHLDVGANVAFGLRMQGRASTDRTRRVSQLLELVGLSGTQRRPIQTLSGGEQQRVALARSLAPEPRVLLLDEPFGALDGPLRERLLSEVRQLIARLGLTVVAVTHDQLEAFALADRLVVMDGGRVLQSGTPSAVWRAPGTARIAHLLGFTNVAPARAEGGRLLTPWGDLGPTQGEIGAVLLRPRCLHVDPLGSIDAEVLTTTFAGDVTRVRVAVVGAPPLDLEISGGDAPRIGAAVRLRVGEGAVCTLPG